MFTRKQLEEKQAKGLIRGFTTENQVKPSYDNKVGKKRAEKIKGWIQLHLQHWAEAHRLELETEYQFDPERKWRFDYAIPKIKCAFEYEGLSSKKNGHTTKQGYTSNTEKYNEAAAQGWRLIRYTYLNYKDLIRDLNKLL